MVGPDVGPATQTLRIYVHHRLVRPAASSSSSSSSSRASAIGSRSRGGHGVGNGGGGRGEGGGPSWALRIEGGVLQAAARAESGPCLSPHYYFTEFFDRVTVLGLQQETVVPRRGGGAMGEGGGEEGDEIEVCRAGLLKEEWEGVDSLLGSLTLISFFLSPVRHPEDLCPPHTHKNRRPRVTATFPTSSVPPVPRRATCPSHSINRWPRILPLPLTLPSPFLPLPPLFRLHQSVGPDPPDSGHRRTRVLPAPGRSSRRRRDLKSPHSAVPPSIPRGATAGTTAAVPGAEQSIAAAEGGEARDGGSSVVRADRNEAAFPPSRAGVD